MLIMLIIPFMGSQDLLSRRCSEALTGRNDNRSTEKYSRREEKKWNTGYIKKTVTKYETGEYGWTTDLETVKRQVDWQLKELKTDYIDYGFIHCLDASSDWRDYQENGILAYLQEMKKNGVVRHIGLSSHTPALAAQVLDTGIADQLMFSINPAYDYQHGDFARGSASERMEFYRRCQAEGIRISVMKPYSGGQLLSAQASPFGQALTTYQCIQYALDKPGVLTVLPGIRYDRTQEQDMEIVRRVHHLAERYGVKMQQIALAWEWAKGVTAPIIGATKASHFDDAAGAFSVKLTAEDIAFLEEPYMPHRIVGAIDGNPPEGTKLLDVKK